MIEKEEYCVDIITQSLAIQKSLGSFNKLILENHLKTHLKDNLSSPEVKKQDAAIKELLTLYELTHVRGK